MRALLYGTVSGGGWRWCVSVALAADAVWWERRGVMRLWIMDREKLSLGQAFERREMLMRAGMQNPVEGEGSWVESGRLAGDWILEDPVYKRVLQALEGRCLLREEIDSCLAFHGLKLEEEKWLPYVQWGALEGRFRLRHGVMKEGGGQAMRLRRKSSRGYRCLRCGSGERRLNRTPCPDCGKDCPYCEACLGMGRVRFCSLFVQGIRVQGKPGVPAARQPSMERWGLSPAQQEAVGEALRFMKGGPGVGRKFLLWAVTGAGKTEMIFPLVERTLTAGGCAVIATPRKDVVLELAPRVKAAFPFETPVSLYGGSEERWATGRLVLATTHQLFRFREAFDLVVLDEMDAFPFHGNPQLVYAAESALSGDGKFVLLSATPPAKLRRLARWGRLPHAKVCVRFHRRPLPVPRRLIVPPIRRWSTRAVPPRLREALHQSVARGASCFVFVPYVEAVTPLVRLFRAAFPDVRIDGTSSKDEERTAKVASFRERDIQMIITTTILERGVTVAKTDVFILDADHGLFDDAALVQMAGRAGRKLEDPEGNVYFCAPDWTKGQRIALREIKRMNKLAKRKGYFTP